MTTKGGQLLTRASGIVSLLLGFIVGVALTLVATWFIFGAAQEELYLELSADHQELASELLKHRQALGELLERSQP